MIEDGRVCGAEILLSSGERRRIGARSTLLATGGFGGDPDLRERHIHPLARDIPLRANLYSTGDGLRLGLAAGAAFGKERAGFYGHLMPSHVAYRNPYEFTDLTFYHSEHGVLLNLDGRRFCDETIGDHISALAVLEQREARALLVTDQRVHDEWMMVPYVQGVEPLDKFALAYRRGARAVVGYELDEFADLPEEWGYPGAASRDALRESNRQCVSGARSCAQAGCNAARASAVLRHRGHPGHHVHVRRAPDRSARARARRARPYDTRPARRRCGRGGTFRTSVRGGLGQRLDIRASGGTDRAGVLSGQPAS